MQTIIQYFQSKKNLSKISIVTCYDASSAKIISSSPIDAILVGDSLGMVVQGYDSTLPVTLEDMIYHSGCVKRGAHEKYIISDLPFLSYQSSLESGILSAGRLMKETLVDAIKIEGAGIKNIRLIKELNEIGIPVMGHLGLTPQSFQVLGGYKIQGKEPDAAKKILDDAVKLEKAGAFSIVLEMIPSELGEKISKTVKIPTIGIGAGSHTDGQVLVINDLLGMDPKFAPKFLKKYNNLHNAILNSLNEFHSEVVNQVFPGQENSF